MSLHIEVVPDRKWAEVIASKWAQRLEARPTLRMCLPTGSTPRPLYRAVADRADFSSSTIFVLDEFGLPEGDPARCDQMLRRDLLEHLPAPLAQLECLNPQAADLEAECNRYEMLLAQGGLDLTLLGLGANGHLGLNEPGSDSTSPTRVVHLAPSTAEGIDDYGALAKTNWGMTIGLARLLESDEIWLLVTGAHKAEVLAGAMKDAVGPRLPATYLHDAKNVVVWADESAASLL